MGQSFSHIFFTFFTFFYPGRRVVFSLAKRGPFNKAAGGLNLN